MARACRETPPLVNQTSSAPAALSVLSLQIQVLDDRPADRPVVTILVDGAPPFEGVAPGWRGFDPDDLLGADSPLLPPDYGRRTALLTCSCGVGGCGVMAPYVVPSPDGRRVSWVDFRDYVGVFDQPVARGSEDHEGRPWDLPDLHFDRAQYEAEVARAAADRSWETPRRTLSRLIRERAKARPDMLPPGRSLRFVCPAWHDEDGIVIALTVTEPDGQGTTDGPLLHLRTGFADPVAATDAITELLGEAPAEELRRRFGYHAPRRSRSAAAD